MVTERAAAEQYARDDDQDRPSVKARIDEIEERLHRLAAFDKAYTDNFWREPRWDGRSTSERLGAAGDDNVLVDLTEELWEAEEVFKFMSGRR